MSVSKGSKGKIHWFPLTKKQRKQMKKGKEVMQHYHDVTFPDDTMAVIVGKDWKKEKYEYLRYRGIDIAGIHLTDEQIDQLDREVIMSQQNSPDGFPITIGIIDTEFLKEVLKNE